MYLEISGRITHKTSRLVRELESWLAIPTNYAVLTVHQHAWAKELTRMINPRYHNRMFVGVEFETTIRNLRGTIDPNSPKVKYFFDEFDFCKPRNVPVIDNAVYVTTPKFTRKYENWQDWRNDALLRLIVANDFTYTVHHGMKHFFDNDKVDMDISIAQIGEERFDSEFMCTFNTSEREQPKRNPFKSKFVDDFRCGRI